MNAKHFRRRKAMMGAAARKRENIPGIFLEMGKKSRGHGAIPRRWPHPRSRDESFFFSSFSSAQNETNFEESLGIGHGPSRESSTVSTSDLEIAENSLEKNRIRPATFRVFCSRKVQCAMLTHPARSREKSVDGPRASINVS